MKNYPSPSPSKIVMTAILELKQDRGTSLGDIVKYAKCKYGLSGDSLKKRISAALKRGIKYNIIYLQRGLYHVNKTLCKIPPDPEYPAERQTGESSGKNYQQVRTKKSVKCFSSNEGRLNNSSRGALKKQQDRKKKIKRKSFLCPECQEWIRTEKEGYVTEESEKNQRYELRPRKTPSQSSNEVPAKGYSGQRSKKEEKKSEGKSCTPWKDYLRMKISLSSPHRSKDKK